MPVSMAAKLELTAALGDFDLSDLAGPVVDVLEQVTVDGFQVGEIELAARDSAFTAARYELPSMLSFFCIMNAKLLREP
jgi:hypothetical protein